MSWIIEQRDPDDRVRFVAIAGALSGRTVWTDDPAAAGRYRNEDDARALAAIVAADLLAQDELPDLTIRELA